MSKVKNRGKIRKNIFNIEPIKIMNVKSMPISMNKIKSFGFTSKKMMNIPSIGTRKRAPPKKPNKDLTYPQARARYSLSPYGNWDKDKVLNIDDCRPFDFTRHAVPEEHKHRKVQIYAKKKQQQPTFKSVFAEAEKHLPQMFKGSDEDECSDLLSSALLKRETVGETPFKNVVGVYTIDVQMDPAQTQLVQRYLGDYLIRAFPDQHFEFSKTTSTKVIVTDLDSDNVRKRAEMMVDGMGRKTGRNLVVRRLKSGSFAVVDVDTRETVKKFVPKSEERNVANYLRDAPKDIKDLLTLLNPGSKVKVWITDHPVDILMKTEGQSWSSCERWGGQYESGPFGDVRAKNAIAYYYFGDKVPGRDSASGRVMLRWGKTPGGKKGIGIEKDVYPYSKSAAEEGKYNKHIGLALRDGLQELLQSMGYSKTAVRVKGGMGFYSDYAGGVSSDITYEPYEKYASKRVDIHEYKRKIASKKDLPTPFVEQLAFETSPEIRKSIAKQTKLSQPHIHRFAKDAKSEVRYEIAMRKPLPYPDVVKTLSRDVKSPIRAALIEKVDIEAGEELKLPKSVIRSILSDTEAAYQLAISSKKQSPEVLMLLAAHKNDAVRKAVAGRNNLPPNIVKILKEDKHPSVLSSIFETYGMTEREAKELAKQKNAEVNDIIVYYYRKQLPSSVLLEIIKNGGSTTQQKIAAKSYDLPSDVIRALIKTDKEIVLQQLATRPDLSSSVYEELADSQFEEVHYELLFDNTTIKNNSALLENITKRILRKADSELIFEILRKNVVTDSIAMALTENRAMQEDWEMQSALLDQLERLARPVRVKIITMFIEIGDVDTLRSMLRNQHVPASAKEAIRAQLGET